MSESTPPNVAGSASGSGSQPLSDEAIEAVLADFRDWLRQLGSEPAPPGSDGEAAAPLDLHTLLAQFVALRHEVNLQTKAARAQQEQNAETLRQLSTALESLQQTEAADEPPPPSDELLRPLLKTLVDLYDALALAERECRRVREASLPALDQLVLSEPLATPPVAVPPDRLAEVALPFWARWVGIQHRVNAALALHQAGIGGRLGDSQRDELLRRQSAMQQAIQSIRQMLDSLVTGYTMSLQRIDRGLRQHGLEPIPTVGQPFDPEQMEVVEVVPAGDRPSGEVVAEIRRGYLWNGRVFRFAQVSVAKW